MSIPYQITFVVLCLEMALMVLLIAPFPQHWRRAILNWVANSEFVAAFYKRFWFIVISVAVLFVDSLMKARKYGDATHLEHLESAEGGHIIAHSKDLVADKFYAQRNLYLTGATLFLALILTRFYALVKEISEREKKSYAGEEAMKKQMEGLRREYDRITEEKKKPSANDEAMKKQMEGLQREYNRIAEENQELKKKLDKLPPADKKND